METNHSTVSSLTFNIQTGNQIQGIVNLIQHEAKKEGCIEPEVTLVSTAISEVCRRFIKHSTSMELTLALLRRPHHVNLQGKATTKDTPDNLPWEKVIDTLSTCFTDSNFHKDRNSLLVSYSFQKTIPCK